MRILHPQVPYCLHQSAADFSGFEYILPFGAFIQVFVYASPGMTSLQKAQVPGDSGFSGTGTPLRYFQLIYTNLP